jgi:hypothetical protein
MAPIFEVKDSSRSMFDLKPPICKKQHGSIKQSKGLTAEFKQLVIQSHSVKHKEKFKLYAM